MHVGRTNQKLYFADLSLKQAKQCTDQQSRHCFNESAIFHLKGTVTAFLQELKIYYAVSGDVLSIYDLDEKIIAKGQVSMEVLQLKQYVEDDFLAELEHTYEQIWSSTQQVVKRQSNSEIQLFNQEDSGLPDIETLESWQLKLKHFIDECREQMGES